MDIDKNIRFRRRKIEVSLKALIENVSNSLNLNLDAASKTIITKAKIAIEVRKTPGKCIKDAPLYFILFRTMPIINNKSIFGIFINLANEVHTIPIRSITAI